MPTITPRTFRTPIAAGDHVLSLVSVTMEELPSFRDPEVKVPRLVWQFQSKLKDPATGERYEFRQFTGLEYGGPKAALTTLLDQMCPDISEENKSHLVTDDLVGDKFKARIRHEKPDKDGDPPKPRLVFIEPYVAGAKTDAPVGKLEELADADDPFADQ